MNVGMGWFAAGSQAKLQIYVDIYVVLNYWVKCGLFYFTFLDDWV
jgi:hypothetical protein